MEKHNIKAGRRVKRWRENHVQVMQVKKTLSITTNHLLFALSIGTASLLFEVGCLSEKSMNWPQQEYLTIPGWLWSDIRSGLMWATHIVLPSHLTVPLPANYQASSHTVNKLTLMGLVFPGTCPSCLHVFPQDWVIVVEERSVSGPARLLLTDPHLHGALHGKWI